MGKNGEWEVNTGTAPTYQCVEVEFGSGRRIKARTSELDFRILGPINGKPSLSDIVSYRNISCEGFTEKRGG